MSPNMRFFLMWSLLLFQPFFNLYKKAGPQKIWILLIDRKPENLAKSCRKQLPPIQSFFLLFLLTLPRTTLFPSWPSKSKETSVKSTYVKILLLCESKVIPGKGALKQEKTSLCLDIAQRFSVFFWLSGGWKGYTKVQQFEDHFCFSLALPLKSSLVCGY